MQPFPRPLAASLKAALRCRCGRSSTKSSTCPNCCARSNWRWTATRPPVAVWKKQIGNKTLRPPLPRPIKYQSGPLCIATLSCHGRVDPDLC